MDGVTESLPQLFSRRMGDLKVSTVRQLYQRLPQGDGVDRVTYETVRKLHNGEQRGSRDQRVPRDLALMLEVSENEIRSAMKMPPTFGEFELPPRAQALDPQERVVVMAVVDALLRAKRGSDAQKMITDVGGSTSSEGLAADEDEVTLGSPGITSLEETPTTGAGRAPRPEKDTDRNKSRGLPNK